MKTPRLLDLDASEGASLTEAEEAEIRESLSRAMSIINEQMSVSFDTLFANLTGHLERVFDSDLTSISEQFKSLLATALRPLEVLNPPSLQVAKQLGWVIHHTFPSTLLEETPEEDLDDAILNYYQAEWMGIRRTLVLDTDSYLIDEDSKGIMKQALAGHEAGLYRLIPRSMLPEIETLIRKELHQGKPQVLNMTEEVKIFEEIPISFMRDWASGLSGYEALTQTLYEHVKTEYDQTKVAANPIPNRHATVHGLVAYAAEKTSLNSIFLADFAFDVFTKIKRSKIKQAASILSNLAAARSRSNQPCPSPTS